MDALAQSAQQRQMVAPGAVDAGERHHPLGIGDGLLARRRHERRAALGRPLPDVRDVLARQNRLPPLDELPCCSSTTAA